MRRDSLLFPARVSRLCPGDITLHATCRLCGRTLSNPESQLIGYGPVCAARIAPRIVQPTIEDAQGYSKDEIVPMLLDTEERQMDLFKNHTVARGEWEKLLKLDPIMVEGDFFTKTVRLNGVPLDHGESLKYCNHSPSGFSWGYGGSGPAQLALAILLRIAPPPIALALYQAFKWEFVACWAREYFCESIDVAHWFAAKAQGVQHIIQE